MKRFAAVLALAAWSALAHASGLPWAVDTLEKARALAGKAPARHVLVFYTSPD